MRYKIGDKVKVKSREWYDENKDEYGTVELSGFPDFVKDMAVFCGKKATIRSRISNTYGIDIDNGPRFFWTDEMFEEQPKNETNGTEN